MNLLQLEKRVRAHARDFNSTIFRKTDIVTFINEAIDRFAQVIPELSDVPHLVTDSDEVKIIPKAYVHLLANYATARLFSQDERHYEATVLMNEFELKIDEFHSKIEDGTITLIDPSTGESIDSIGKEDYVTDNYFYGSSSSSDTDDGVEGVE